MPPKRAQKSSAEQLATYDLRKVATPKNYRTGHELVERYEPTMPIGHERAEKALRARLLTIAEQKKQAPHAQQPSQCPKPPPNPSRYPSRPSQHAPPAPPPPETEPEPEPEPSLTQHRRPRPSTQRNASGNRGVARRGSKRGGARSQSARQEQEVRKEGQSEAEDSEENEGIRLGASLLRAKDAFKQYMLKKRLEQTAQNVRDQADEIETSEVEGVLWEAMADADEVAPFTIEVNYRVYISKKLEMQKTLPDMKSNNFELFHIEEAIRDGLSQLSNATDINVSKQTACLRTKASRGRSKIHDIMDFGLRETQTVLEIAQSIQKQHPRSAVVLTLEIHADRSALPAQPPIQSLERKRKAPTISHNNPDAEAFSNPSSSPPQPAAKKSARQAKLGEEQTVRLEALRLAGNFHRQLADRHQCRERNCTNLDNYCFVDPVDGRSHYPITHVQQEQWARSIATAEATVSNPPTKLYQFWLNGGAITREAEDIVRKLAVTNFIEIRAAPKIRTLIKFNNKNIFY